jgi:Sugar (and other) transporter
MFDQNVRTLAQAFAAMNNCKYRKSICSYLAIANSLVGFWNFMVSRFTPQMFATMGYGVYFFFASLMICSVVFVYFLMPETKNIPLEGIDRLFDRRLKAREAHSIVWKELAEEEEALRIGLTSGSMEKDTTTAQIENVEQKV